MMGPSLIPAAGGGSDPELEGRVAALEAYGATGDAFVPGSYTGTVTGLDPSAELSAPDGYLDLMIDGLGNTIYTGYFDGDPLSEYIDRLPSDFESYVPGSSKLYSCAIDGSGRFIISVLSADAPPLSFSGALVETFGLTDAVYVAPSTTPITGMASTDGILRGGSTLTEELDRIDRTADVDTLKSYAVPMPSILMGGAWLNGSDTLGSGSVPGGIMSIHIETDYGTIDTTLDLDETTIGALKYADFPQWLMDQINGLPEVNSNSGYPFFVDGGLAYGTEGSIRFHFYPHVTQVTLGGPTAESIGLDANHGVSFITSAGIAQTKDVLHGGNEALDSVIDETRDRLATIEDAVLAKAAKLVTPYFSQSTGDMDDGGKFTFTVSVDGGVGQAVDIVVPIAENFNWTDVVGPLNDQLVGAKASLVEDDWGKISIVSDLRGALSEIAIASITASRSDGSASTASLGFTSAGPAYGQDSLLTRLAALESAS